MDGLFLVGSGGILVANLAIYKYISPFLSAHFVKTYRTLSREDQVHWNRTAASQIFSILCSGLAIYGMMGEEVNADIVWGKSPVTHLICSLTNGYMIADVLVFTLLEPGILFDKVYLLHHSVSIASAVAIVASQSSAHAFFFRASVESSSVFLNLGWFLKKVYGKASTAFQLCAVIFALTFIFSRILVLPGYYIKYLHALQSTPVWPPVYMLVITLPLGMMMDLLNFYWLHLVIKGLAKIFFPSKERT